MDLLGDQPLIDMESWGIRTNLDHRSLRDYQPAHIGQNAEVSNSLIYNGCVVEGAIRNSILFPGVHVGDGSVIEDSVIFFSNTIGRECCFKRMISDVNTVYEDRVEIGADLGAADEEITVVGWNNRVPVGTRLGRGITVSPFLDREKWLPEVESGRVL
jgi:glucose-1-phosphate adenylyltransferase